MIFIFNVRSGDMNDEEKIRTFHAEEAHAILSKISKTDFEKMGFVEGRCTIEIRVGLYGKNL